MIIAWIYTTIIFWNIKKLLKIILNNNKIIIEQEFNSCETENSEIFEWNISILLKP